VHADRRAGLQPLAEVIAFEHARQRVARGELDHAARAERIAPFAVVADLGPGRIEHQAGLRVVGLRVGLDLLARQRRAGGVAAGRVADHRREVADQENYLMPQVLQLAHLVQHHRMAEVDVRRGRVQAELDAQRLPGRLRARQLLQPVGLGQQLVAAAARHRQRVPNRLGNVVRYLF
jgi:hypothetical protein